MAHYSQQKGNFKILLKKKQKNKSNMLSSPLLHPHTQARADDTQTHTQTSIRMCTDTHILTHCKKA
uniref:Uncharacterized protein n=1 Tax=Anguilla anguilla TaxID=7936 RepID=A0A0E9S9W8_ANGAN